MRDEITQLTRELVSIPSHEDETEAGDYIEDWLADETDADVRRDDIGNVLAYNDTGKGDGVALVGHHDVVPPSESQVEDGDYVVEESDGRLYGRGTADMKGALASAMLGFRDSDSGVFASFVGEEDGGVGARHAIDEGFAPSRAVVTEGSTGYSSDGVVDVAVAHKGRRETRVVANGKAAHASEVEEGENAVYAACDAVGAVRGAEFPRTEVYGDEMEGSVCVTLIEGGNARNVVPERCEFTVDERTVPGETASFGFGDSVESEVVSHVPAMVCDDEEFADAVLGVASGRQSESPELVTKPHATDAGWLSEAGTDCVVCGPAEPGEAHTEDESVSVNALETCYAVYRDALGV